MELNDKLQALVNRINNDDYECTFSYDIRIDSLYLYVHDIRNQKKFDKKSFAFYSFSELTINEIINTVKNTLY